MATTVPSGDSGGGGGGGGGGSAARAIEMEQAAREAGELIPPENFAMVTPGVYRSGFPKRKNLPFLRHVGVRSILTLVLEEYPEANSSFNEEHGVRLFQYGVPGNKEPFVDIPENVIRRAVEQLLDVRNHPVLIHCNKGKHRTGCLVGCLRKACGWSLCSILDEYIRFSHPKSRFMDQQFIELFDISRVRLKRKYVPSWVPNISHVSAPGAQMAHQHPRRQHPLALQPPETQSEEAEKKNARARTETSTAATRAADS